MVMKSHSMVRNININKKRGLYTPLRSTVLTQVVFHLEIRLKLAAITTTLTIVLV